MSRENRLRLYRAGIAILSGCVICLIINVILVFSLKNAFKKDASIAVQNSELSEVFGPGYQSRAMEISLYLDSILSIIQSYYVDSSRVAAEDMLRMALNVLAAESGVELIEKNKSVTIRVDGRQYRFQLERGMKYRQLLVSLTKAALVIESVHKDDSGKKKKWEHSGHVMVLNSILKTLDAHSSLLSPDDYRELRQGTEGSFGGLGVLVGIRDHLLTVIKPLPKSPALRAGLKKYDHILSINGNSTYGYSLDDLVEYMRGDPGTDVFVDVLRKNESAPVSYILKREVITVDSVTANVVKRNNLNFLHIKIESFSSRTAQEVYAVVKKFKLIYRNKNSGVILDLRSNPGGLLDQAVEVSDVFLNSGVIVSTKGRRTEIESANNQISETDFPLVVIVNGDSASASEVVAGALQDHGRAVIVGQPSFGKGSVQTIFELPGEQALKLTIARYYTPLGRSIQNVGIIPDVWIQPVMKRKKNGNLLGSFRYRNERFLKNSLMAKQITSNAINNIFKTKLKTYYLSDEEFDEYSDNRQNDYEMDIALDILEENAKSHVVVGDQSGSRAAHWLALALPRVKVRTKHYFERVRSWLKNTHRVTWSDSSSSKIVKASLNLSVSLADGQSEPRLGDEIKLKWQIKNSGDVAVDNTSMFLNAVGVGIESSEILVGKVPAGGSRSGVAVVKIPARVERNKLKIKMGVAVDAIPSLDSQKFVDLKLKSKSFASIEAVAKLVEGKGSVVNGAIEPGEEASIKITISNKGFAHAKNLRASLVNLSGDQVVIVGDGQLIQQIDIGDEQDVYIVIKGSNKIFNKQLEFGLSIEGSNENSTLRRSLKISSLPNMKKRLGTAAVSH